MTMSAFLATEGWWAALALGGACKSVLILTMASAIALSLHRSTAAARHLVWSLALAGILASPLLSLALPSWSWPVLAASDVDAVRERRGAEGQVLSTPPEHIALEQPGAAAQLFRPDRGYDTERATGGHGPGSGKSRYPARRRAQLDDHLTPCVALDSGCLVGRCGGALGRAADRPVCPAPGGTKGPAHRRGGVGRTAARACACISGFDGRCCSFEATARRCP